MESNKFQDCNYIHILGWMVTKLKLKGNDLLLFALIHGFSQDGKSKFYGSNSYICSAINASKNTVLKSVACLEKLNLIIKTKHTENGVDANYFNINLKEVNTILSSAETEQGVVQKLDFDSAETAPNINIYNIKHLYKYKMSDISVSDDYTKLFLETKKEEIEIPCTRAEGYAFFIADQFRHLFIRNIEEKGGIANDQINAKFHSYVNPILLINKKGGYNSDHLRDIYKYLDSDAGEFWKTVILSTATLRKQMQKLILAKNSKQNQTKAPERN